MFLVVMKLKTLLALSFVTLGGAFAPLVSAADAPREIVVTANDAMQFNVKEITATAGEKITVKFSHVGKFPKTSMGHNWVLVKPMSAAALNSFAMACMKAAPEYLPADRSVVIAHTKILGGGESDAITFTAPTTPGEYPYLCSFPGHFSMMKGKLIVK
jgi:azurin